MLDKKEKRSVLFVCMGNICRSPTAEGVFRHLVEQAGLVDDIDVDSAGTHAYHVGNPPDHRSVAAARRRGISMHDIRARRVADDDFKRFDYIIAMDEDNEARLLELAGDEYSAKVTLLMSHSTATEREVPDPYYGGSAGFERVLDMIDAAARELLETIAQSLSR